MQTKMLFLFECLKLTNRAVVSSIDAEQSQIMFLSIHRVKKSKRVNG